MQQWQYKPTKRRSPGQGLPPQGLPPLPPVPIKQPIKLIKLKNPPNVLSSWIGQNPGNICQIASPQKGTGFNAFAWREQISSKLFSSKLYLENLDPVGVINEGLKVTYPEVKSLANESHWENSLPDTIVVKSAGGPMIRMAAKKMVLDLLNSHQSDPDLKLKSPNKPILKETKTDNPGLGEFAIEFSVKGITQIEPIMRPDTFMLNYSHLFSDRLALTLNVALQNYQDKLKAGVVNGFRVEEVAKTPVGKRKPPPNVAKAGEMVEEIKGAAESLLRTLETEIENWKDTKLTRDDLATLKTLRKQVEPAVKSAIDNDFKNELDTRRWPQWLTLKPLTEDQILPGTGTKVGAGVQGAVFKYELDPALRRRPVILKYENNGLNEDAKGAGIPELNPQQSVRAVAAFKMSKQLNLDIIPQTEFFVGTDDDGRPTLGQAMEFVNGTVGQRKAGLKNDAFTDEKVEQLKLNELQTQASKAEPLTDAERSARDEAQAKLRQFNYLLINGKWYLKPPIDQNKIGQLEADQAIVDKLGNLDPKTLEKDQQEMLKDAQDSVDKYVKVKGEWYYADNLPVNIDYGNAVVQKGLSDLQVFDYIIGHADRNPGNWIYEKDKNGRISGVKGIDNDDTFGKDWSPGSSAIPRALGEFASKTPGIPPIVDISTALSILNTDFAKDIQPLLAGLSNEEIDQAAERFDQVQQQVESRVMAGKIASIAPTGDAGVQAKLEALRTLTGASLAQTLRWGNLGIADTHTETNSYLGFQMAQKNQVGVAPESGVGLALLP